MSLKLSLWNFHSWFQQRGISHNCAISSNAGEILGARLGDGETLSGYAVISDAPEQSDCLTAIAYGNDRIYVHELSPLAVMDELNCMYNALRHWQRELKKAILTRSGLNAILDVCGELMPYPIFMFRGDQFVAYSSRHKQRIDSLWKSYQSCSLEELKIIMDSLIRPQKEDCGEVPVFCFSPGGSGEQFLISVTSGRDTFPLRILAFSDCGALSPGDIHFMRELTDAVNRYQSACQERLSSQALNPHSFFFSSAQGIRPNAVQMYQALRFLNWSQNHTYTVCRFETPEGNDSALLDKLSQVLKKRFPASYCMRYAHTVLLVWNMESASGLLEQNALDFALSDHFFIAGQSGYAADMAFLPQLMEQARQAVEKARDRNASFLSSSDFVSDYVAKTLYQDENIQSLIHPSVLRLMRADCERKDGRYVEILRMFLASGGNGNLTARRLHIHRNTLACHLQKIQDIMECSLDDPKERESLRLSLLIARPL